MSSIAAAFTEAKQTELHSTSRFTDDLAPTPAARRKWRLGSFAALWIAMSARIAIYMPEPHWQAGKPRR